MHADIQPNILHWLWLHNAMSTGIWAAFAKYRQIKPLLRDRALLRMCYDASKETLELCRLRGVDLGQYGEVTTFKLPFWLFYIYSIPTTKVCSATQLMRQTVCSKPKSTMMRS